MQGQLSGRVDRQTCDVVYPARIAIPAAMLKETTSPRAPLDVLCGVGDW